MLQGIRSLGNRGEPHDEEVKPSRSRGVMKHRQRDKIEKAQGKKICLGRRLQERIW